MCYFFSLVDVSDYFLTRYKLIFVVDEKDKGKMFIQIKNIWYYNVYIHKLKLSINYSD